MKIKKRSENVFRLWIILCENKHSIPLYHVLLLHMLLGTLVLLNICISIIVLIPDVVCYR